jgi:hypothetical protein
MAGVVDCFGAGLFATLFVLPELVAAVGASGLSEARVAALRQRFTARSLTFCRDEDVCGAEPIPKGEGFNLHPLDVGGHCRRLTRELARASGILVAKVERDEG